MIRVVTVHNISVLPSRLVVEEDDLRVLFAFDLIAHAHTVLLFVGINIDDLPVTPVPEKETSLGVSIDLKVGRVVVNNLLTFPRVEG